MDVHSLLDTSKLDQFWPSTYSTPVEKSESTTRFLFYATIIALLITSDVRYLVIGALFIAFIWYTSGPVVDEDYEEPPPPPADDLQFPYSRSQHESTINFHKPPTNDLGTFLSTTYPRLYNNQVCRDNPAMCSPDARGAGPVMGRALA
jgi:hypothetical protein